MTKYTLVIQDGKPCGTEVNPLGKAETCCSGTDCGCMGLPINFGSKQEFEEWKAAESNLMTLEICVVNTFQNKGCYNTPSPQTQTKKDV